MKDLRNVLESFNCDGGLSEFNSAIIECCAVLNASGGGIQSAKLVDAAFLINSFVGGVVAVNDKQETQI
jgi:hypothetical protein